MNGIQFLIRVIRSFANCDKNSENRSVLNEFSMKLTWDQLKHIFGFMVQNISKAN